MRSLRLILVAVLCVMLLDKTADAQNTLALGMKVVAIDNDATLKDSDQAFRRVKNLHWPCTIEKMDGSSMLVTDGTLHVWVDKTALATFDEAMTRYAEASVYQPTGANLSRFGMILFCHREYDAAIDRFTKAIPKAENDFSRGVYHRNRGEAWAAKGDPLNAIEDYNEAIPLLATSPRSLSEAYRLRAAARDKLGDKEAAERDRLEAVRVKLIPNAK